MTGFVSNIVDKTLSNSFFRQVLYTSKHMQLVVMCLQKGEDIGVEVHEHVDQFFRIESGEAKFIINGEESFLRDDNIAIVPAGAKHNVINIGNTELKLYTIYTPPNHIDGRIHKTKADALVDAEDEGYTPTND